jgi:PknH-like extracellular domain
MGMCTLAVGCTNNVGGNAVPADKSGPFGLPPVPTSGLDGLLLDPDQITSALGAPSVKVWFDTKKMWDWSADMNNASCLGVDGPGQDKVYTHSGWTSIRGQRLDDSVDGSTRRQHYAIQAVVAFPSARDAAAFYKTQTQSWSACAHHQFSDVNPGQPDTIWTVADVTDRDGTLSTTEAQEGDTGWTCQRALTVRNNVAIDIVACSTNPGTAATDIAIQIAAKVNKQ